MTSDLNHQTTSYSYDSLGRMNGETLPGESAGATTTQWSYTDWCTGTVTQSPCTEVDEIDRLSSTTTTISRAFYDGEGHRVAMQSNVSGTSTLTAYIGSINVYSGI